MKKTERRELFREIVAMIEELEKIKRDTEYDRFISGLEDEKRIP